MKTTLQNYIIDEWFEKAKVLKPGERLHIPVVSKNDLRHMKSELERLRKGLGLLEPELAHSIVIGDLFTREDGGKKWITISKRVDSPLKGYVTTGEGVYKVEIEPSSRKRMLILMARDGYSKEQAEEIVGELEPAEVEEYF